MLKALTALRKENIIKTINHEMGFRQIHYRLAVGFIAVFTVSVIYTFIKIIS